MFRRFLSGLSWGAATSVVGLSLISQIAMPTYRSSHAADDLAAPENSVVAAVSPTENGPGENGPGENGPGGEDAPALNTEAVAPKVQADPPVKADRLGDASTSLETAVALPEMTPAAAVEPSVPEAALLAEPKASTGVAPVTSPRPNVESALPEVRQQAPRTADQPAVPGQDAAPKSAAAKGMAALDAGEAAPKVEAAPAAVEKPLPAAETTPATATAEPVTPARHAPAPVQQAPEIPAPEPAPEVASDTVPAAVPETVPEPAAIPDVAAVEPPAKPNVLDTKTEVTLVPDTGLSERVDGVVTGRLAVIEPKPAKPIAAGDSVDPSVDLDLVTIPSAQPSDASPLVKYAQDFDAENAKPLFAILLVDDGSADLDRLALAKVPLAVSFVIDPLAANAKEAAAVYRAAGREILMLASGIPAGATAGDIEQTFQAHAAVLPESVAVLDLPQNGFQDNSALASLVVPILGAQGRGLITFDRGLNSANQVAQREEVPAAQVFRILDADNEAPALIRRYLDRAAFKAAQEGHVMVMGMAGAQTVSAIMEWAVEGRSTTVALVPATAVLGMK